MPFKNRAFIHSQKYAKFQFLSPKRAMYNMIKIINITLCYMWMLLRE